MLVVLWPCRNNGRLPTAPTTPLPEVRAAAQERSPATSEAPGFHHPRLASGMTWQALVPSSPLQANKRIRETSASASHSLLTVACSLADRQALQPPRLLSYAAPRAATVLNVKSPVATVVPPSTLRCRTSYARALRLR